jgi:hypothetical protein
VARFAGHRTELSISFERPFDSGRLVLSGGSDIEKGSRTMSTDEYNRQCVAWACGTIAVWAPHLALESTSDGWRIYWRDDAGKPDFELPLGPELTTVVQLCKEARHILDECRR